MARKGSVVKSEMGGAFPSVSTRGDKGQYGRNNPPFDHPHSMGGGGIPMKFFEHELPTVPATTLAAQNPKTSRGKPR